jgi:5-methylcytosine-specific restriction endonuclease McrA
MNYKNKDWLTQKYIVEKLTIYQIGEITNHPPRTIHSWLIKFDIPRRKSGVECWSDEQKELWSKQRKGHKPTLLRPRTKEENLKISVSLKEHYKNTPSKMKGRKLSDDTKLKMSLTRRGKDNPQWKGGITTITRGIRRSPEYYQWRKDVISRDKCCRDCGSILHLNAHHIKEILYYPELIFDVTNGLTLCEDCHKRHSLWQKINLDKKRG